MLLLRECRGFVRPCAVKRAKRAKSVTPLKPIAQAPPFPRYRSSTHLILSLHYFRLREDRNKKQMLTFTTSLSKTKRGHGGRDSLRTGQLSKDRGGWVGQSSGGMTMTNARVGGVAVKRRVRARLRVWHVCSPFTEHSSQMLLRFDVAYGGSAA